MVKIEADVDVLESQAYAASSQPSCSSLTLAFTSGFFFVIIEGTPLKLPPLNLEREHWFEGSLPCRPQSALLKTRARFLDFLKTHAAVMRRSGCSHDVEVVVTRMWVSMMVWYQGWMVMLIWELMMMWYQYEVCKSRIEIIWVDHVSCHVPSSCDWWAL